MPRRSRSICQSKTYRSLQTGELSMQETLIKVDPRKSAYSSMPETLIKVDLTQSAYDNDMIHNRCHPDVASVAWVSPGDDFLGRDLGLARRLHKKQQIPRRRARHRSVDLPFLSRPDRRKGPR